MEHHEHLKHIVDSFSIGGTLATMLGWIQLPHITAVLSFFWIAGRLLEMTTGKAVHVHLKAWRDKDGS